LFNFFNLKLYVERLQHGLDGKGRGDAAFFLIVFFLLLVLNSENIFLGDRQDIHVRIHNNHNLIMLLHQLPVQNLWD
jgi:hypothetical protein